MKDIGEFLVLRYSLVEEAQRSLEVAALPAPKGAAISIALIGDREFIKNSVLYAFVGFAVAKPTPLHDFAIGRYLVGKVAKLRTAHVGEKVPGDIIERQADDWIPLITVVDLEEQFIFVQHDWKFGQKLKLQARFRLVSEILCLRNIIIVSSWSQKLELQIFGP